MRFMHLMSCRQRGVELLIFCARDCCLPPHTHTPLSCLSPTLHTVPTPYSAILLSSPLSSSTFLYFFPLLCKLIWLKECPLPTAFPAASGFFFSFEKTKQNNKTLEPDCCCNSQIFAWVLIYLPTPKLDSHLLAFRSCPTLTPIP